MASPTAMAATTISRRTRRRGAMTVVFRWNTAEEEIDVRSRQAGVMGSYNTFSTWMRETQLVEERQLRSAIANGVAGVVLGVAAAGCGQLIGARL